jgi:formate dehydrogenase iron-sulfur subunit
MMRLYLSADSFALAKGADKIAIALKQACKERGLACEVIRVGSRGMAWLEPLIEVETPQGRVGYGPVSVRDVSGLLDAGLMSAGEHRLCAGKIDDHPWMRGQTRFVFARCGVINQVDLESFRREGGWRGLEQARALGPAATIDIITKSGLRGRGGAGFPAGVKWKGAANAKADAKYVVCNADEGDSGTFADRMLMEGDPFSLIEGMAIAGFAIGASKGYVYSRSEYPRANTVFAHALTLARNAGVLGETFDIELRIGAGAYVCGEETALLDSIEGKRGMVRAKPPLPVHQGLFGKPTVINNVLTLASAPWILTHGAEAYATIGYGRSRGTMPIQLSGVLKHTGLYEAPFGMTLGELINDIGGGSRTGRPIRAVQCGGPLGAYFPPSLFDTPYDYEAFAALDGLIGHGGIVAFDDSIDMAEQARFAMEFCAIESCGKCTPCRIGAVRGQEVIDRIRAGEKVEMNLAVLTDLCQTMRLGSLCALGGFTPYPVLSALRHFPQDFVASPKLEGALP